MTTSPNVKKLWDLRGYEVLDGALPSDIGMIHGNIPKIIHLTYKNEKFKGYRVKCIESIYEQSKKDGCVIVLWTDEDIYKLVDQKLDARQQKTFNWYPLMILKIDFIRAFFLYFYGGIYLDSDVFMRKPFSANFPSYKADFYANHTNAHMLDGVQNSVMASRKNDDFVRFYIEKMVELIEEMHDPNYSGKVSFSGLKIPLLGKLVLRWMVPAITGPNMLGNAMLRYSTHCSELNKKDCSIVKGLNEHRYSTIKGDESLKIENQGGDDIVVEHDNGRGESTWYSTETLCSDIWEILFIVTISLLGLILIVILITHYSTKHHIHRTSHTNFYRRQKFFNSQII